MYTVLIFSCFPTAPPRFTYLRLLHAHLLLIFAAGLRILDLILAAGRNANGEDERMREKHDGYESVQAAILGTAAQLFTRAGIHGTSLNDIAQAAGLSKGTLYYYYPTKEALVNDIAETHGARVTDLLLSWVETLSRDCPMDEALLLLMEALLEDEALRRLHVVLFTESCLDNPGLAALMEDKLKKWTVMLEVGTLKVQSDSARRLRDRSSLFFTMLMGAMLRAETSPAERSACVALLLSE